MQCQERETNFEYANGNRCPWKMEKVEGYKTSLWSNATKRHQVSLGRVSTRRSRTAKRIYSLHDSHFLWKRGTLQCILSRAESY